MTPAKLGAHIKLLKAGGLHTKPGSDPSYGYYQHPLIQTCMNQMLFRFKCNLGVQFAELFKEPTQELVCFFCSMLQFVIEERKYGKTGSKDLDFEDQRKAYNTHVTSHTVWLGIAEERWKFVQKQLFSRAFKNILHAEDLRPDIPNPQELAEFEEEMVGKKGEAGQLREGWDGLDNQDPPQTGSGGSEMGDQTVIRTEMLMMIAPMMMNGTGAAVGMIMSPKTIATATNTNRTVTTENLDTVMMIVITTKAARGTMSTTTVPVIIPVIMTGTIMSRATPGAMISLIKNVPMLATLTGWRIVWHRYCETFIPDDYEWDLPDRDGNSEDTAQYIYDAVTGKHHDRYAPRNGESNRQASTQETAVSNFSDDYDAD
ncbi:hypothetical protein FRC11_007705, partial [Ceratobasidium sp. 423]